MFVTSENFETESELLEKRKVLSDKPYIKFCRKRRARPIAYGDRYLMNKEGIYYK